MCGRYTLHHSTDQIVMRFDVQHVLEPVLEGYNIAPTQNVACVVKDREGRALEALRWGLVPMWAKEDTGGRMINARAETLAERPAFRSLLMRKRCLIPADGFYEWRKEQDVKQPFYIRRMDGDLFAFAGLWDEWRSSEGERLRTCTIITTMSNDVAREVHDRMPAMLLRQDEDRWLEGDGASASDLVSLLAPYPAEEMEAYPVSRRVNTPSNNDPSCIAPLAA